MCRPTHLCYANLVTSFVLSLSVTSPRFFSRFKSLNIHLKNPQLLHETVSPHSRSHPSSPAYNTLLLIYNVAVVENNYTCKACNCNFTSTSEQGFQHSRSRQETHQECSQRLQAAALDEEPVYRTASNFGTANSRLGPANASQPGFWRAASFSPLKVN